MEVREKTPLTLGQRIADLRINKKGWKQNRLAEECFVTRPTIVRWENGDREPSASNLNSLATALGTSVEYLVSGNEAENRSIYEETGLTQSAIDVLKFLKSKYSDELNMLLSDRETVTNLCEYLSIRSKDTKYESYATQRDDDPKYTIHCTPSFYADTLIVAINRRLEALRTGKKLSTTVHMLGKWHKIDFSEEKAGGKQR